MDGRVCYACGGGGGVGQLDSIASGCSDETVRPAPLHDHVVFSSRPRISRGERLLESPWCFFLEKQNLSSFNQESMLNSQYSSPYSLLLSHPLSPSLRIRQREKRNL